MKHAIAEAIMENGQIRYVDSKLPKGRIHVHLVYDTEEKNESLKPVLEAVKKTSGVYKHIDPAKAVRTLREEWDRADAA